MSEHTRLDDTATKEGGACAPSDARLETRSFGPSDAARYGRGNAEGTDCAGYRRGDDAIIAALGDITEDELNARSAGRWPPRAIVHHLAAREMTSAISRRSQIAAEEPQLAGYGQEGYACRLYDNRPIAPSLAAFRAARADGGRPRPADRGGAGTRRRAHDRAEQIRRARAAVR